MCLTQAPHDTLATIEGSNTAAHTSHLPQPPPDMLACLPPELRAMILENVLAASRPILLDADDSHITLMAQQCNCCRSSFLHRNSAIAILLTCKMYRAEGMRALMACNDFMYSAPQRELSAKHGRHRLCLDAKYLRCIKSLCIVSLNEMDEPSFLPYHLDTVNLLSELRLVNAHLDSLILVSDTPRNQDRLLFYELGSLEMYIPSAFCLLVGGQIKQLCIGSHAREGDGPRGDEPFEDWAVEGRWNEEDLGELLDATGVVDRANGQVVVFESQQNYDDTDVLLRPSLSSSPFMLQDAEQMRGDTCNMAKHKWYGQTLRLVPVTDGRYACKDGFMACQATLRAPRYRESHLKLQKSFTILNDQADGHELDDIEVADEEVDDDEFVELSIKHYEEFRSTQIWWQLAMASIVPGQRKIKDYFSRSPKQIVRRPNVR